MSLVPLDPRNGFKPVPKNGRDSWIARENGDAGRDLPAKSTKGTKKEEEK